MTETRTTRYHVVVGRMCGDDEDHARFYPDTTRAEAIGAFRADVYESEGYDEGDIAKAEAAGEGVFVNLVLSSASEITE